MRKATVIIMCACAAHAQVEQVMSRNAINAHDALVDSFVGNLLNRALQVPLLHRMDLANTVLAKGPGRLTIRGAKAATLMPRIPAGLVWMPRTNSITFGHFSQMSVRTVHASISMSDAAHGHSQNAAGKQEPEQDEALEHAQLHAVLRDALAARRDAFASWHRNGTNCYRVLYGATEGAPGLTVDRYGEVLLFQTFRARFKDEDAGMIVALTKEVEAAVNQGSFGEYVPATLRPIVSHRGAVAEGSSKAVRRTMYRQLQQAIDELWDGSSNAATADDDGAVIWGDRADAAKVVGMENSLAFDCFMRPGQDPGFFIDFRVAREWLRANAHGKTVLNCFAYTATAGVAAAAGGARLVTNVDFSASALEVGRVNVWLNRRTAAAPSGVQASSSSTLGCCDFDTLRAALDGRQQTLAEALRPASECDEDTGFKLIRADMLPTLRQLAGLPAGGRRAKRHGKGKGKGRGRGSSGVDRVLKFKAQTFDIVVLDPPTFATSAFGAVDIVRDYQTLLKPAVLATAPGGMLLVTNHVSSVDLEEWLRICERCCAKAGRPLVRPPEVLTPHLDFPPMADRKHSLKIAVLRV
eukprot:gnl/TRDRNA2_/TRDRNA2_28627_c0_seq1.p1 gnl/TRDRNA2_/TRDRNA2_28627_c0~~gnl/TRDRNA2_/TRDRNA2_28627_c0_seq1.p1  ORF type:complete len:581 (-),score=114.82 gnl/TRDRNA2_/TRDRNA2_28627_c0_seq1:28-1770(-)